MALIPLTKVPANATIKSVTQTLVSTSQSGIEQRRMAGGQRWAFRLSWPGQILSRAEFDALWAWAVAMDGQYGTGTIRFFGHTLPTGVWGTGGTETLAVRTNAAIGDTAIQIKGLAHSNANACAAGDYIQYSNHTKVYLVTALAASDASGYATIQTHPPLMTALTATTHTITVNNIPFTVRIASDTLAGGVENAQRFGLEMDLVEVI